MEVRCISKSGGFAKAPGPTHHADATLTGNGGQGDPVPGRLVAGRCGLEACWGRFSVDKPALTVAEGSAELRQYTACVGICGAR